MKKMLMTIICIMAMLLSGCAGQEQTGSKYAEKQSIEVPAEETLETPPAELKEEDDNMAKKTNIIIETSMGKIEVALNDREAPVTVENFVSYVTEGFYDGTVFHRVIDGFMIQGGGFTADGGKKKTHAPITLESKNGLKNKRGTIAMARTMVPDSATSQFFINVADNAMLDYAPGNDGYAVFGRVTSGMEVVDAIKAVKTTTKNGMADWPVEDVIIEKVYVRE